MNCIPWNFPCMIFFFEYFPLHEFFLHPPITFLMVRPLYTFIMRAILKFRDSLYGGGGGGGGGDAYSRRSTYSRVPVGDK